MNRCTTAAWTLALIAGLAAAGCDGTAHRVAPPDPPAVASSADAAEPTRVVTLAFAGDVHFQLHLAALLAHPNGALGAITRTLRDADLTMVNLESAVTEAGVPDPKELEVPSERYWFRTSPAALDVLSAAGVDVVTMANNHAADYGPSGLADTLRAVRRSPIPVVGIGRDRGAAFAAYRVTVHDTDIAILAADTSPREGSSSVWAAGAHTPGVAAARGSHRRALVRAVRDASARDEVVVVYLHWGVDQRACPTRAQRRTARVLAGAGADVVVGSHAHVQLGAGWLANTYVDYGLGNFLWYHNHHPDSGVLRVRVEDGRVVSDDWAPARIQRLGPPVPRHGESRSRAVARWRALRGCADLRPAPHDLVKFSDLRSSHRGDAAR